MRYELTPRSRPGWWLLAACTALLLVLLLVACGGDGSDEVVPSADGDNASGDDQGGEQAEDREAELLEWVECMRDQGADVPDPEVDADGNLGFPDGIRVTGDGAGDGALARPTEACGSMPRGAAGGGGQVDQSEFEDTVLEYAQCMRDQGVDMPDPEFNDGGGVQFGDPGGAGGGGLDQNDPAFQEAQEACQDIISGLQSGGGPQMGGGAGSSGAG